MREELKKKKRDNRIMDPSEVSIRDAARLGFGFGLGFAGAMAAISLVLFLLNLPVMLGL